MFSLCSLVILPFDSDVVANLRPSFSQYCWSLEQIPNSAYRIIIQLNLLLPIGKVNYNLIHIVRPTSKCHAACLLVKLETYSLSIFHGFERILSVKKKKNTRFLNVCLELIELCNVSFFLTNWEIFDIDNTAAVIYGGWYP